MRYLRQQDLCRADALQGLNTTLIGCGAVGSFVALALCKMGVATMALYDHDSVEEHNLSTQFFSNLDLGKPKVDALANQLAAMTETRVTAIPEAYDGQPVQGLVIAAVDSMTARRRIWKMIGRQSAVNLYIDCRMGAMVGRVFPVHPGSPMEERAYCRTLHRQSEALEEPCTARSIIFTVLGIASATAGIVRAHVMGMPVPHEITQDFQLNAVLVDGRAVA